MLSFSDPVDDTVTFYAPGEESPYLETTVDTLYGIYRDVYTYWGERLRAEDPTQENPEARSRVAIGVFNDFQARVGELAGRRVPVLTISKLIEEVTKYAEQAKKNSSGSDEQDA